MMTISGSNGGKFCDRVSRRGFLRIGALGFGGLTLPQLLRAEAEGGHGSSNRSIIMIYLPGGPPHQDMFDIKTDAPSEVRGEFSDMATKVPGIRICEHLPQLAGMMDRLAVIRSLVGAKDRHESYQCMTGRHRDNEPAGGWPEIGSVVSRLQGGKSASDPAYVNLSPPMQHRPYNFGSPSFLGVAHTPFNPLGEVRSDIALNGISLDRLGDRRRLLSSFDRLRREMDLGGALEGVDAFQAQAFDMMTSSRLLQALDLEREDPRVRERYGKGTERHQGDAAPRLTEQFLVARRLVEAGVRVVTVSFSFWDWHGEAFRSARNNFPDFDRGVSALVEDLHQRGLDREVAVVVWGEFGRTPVINKDGGRDHWPRVACALLAGGGFRTGQVIGATDRLGGEANERPVHFQEVFATLYRHLGIDAAHTTVDDLSGRPRFLVDEGFSPMPELI